LTRDRRGFENTYLMHADRPGDRPRILYWYRTAPGIVLGRPPLDEDAIRAIEDQHPDIEFDWPAILALSEVMTPEDEAPAPRPAASARKNKKDRGPRREDGAEPAQRAVAEVANNAPAEPQEPEEPQELQELQEPQEPRNRLLEELAGREIGARLRARHADIMARIERLDVVGSEKDSLVHRAEALDPELWMTPESVLDGVRKSDALFEELKSAIGQLSRE
jgi:hypothetical protein